MRLRWIWIPAGAALAAGVAAGGPRAGAPAPAGTWYLSADGVRLTLELRAGKDSELTGVVYAPPGVREAVDQVRWNPASGALEFRRTGEGFREWYRGTDVEGVLVGRFARTGTEGRKPDSWEAFDRHVTGWHADRLDREIVPRVYELLINRDYRARLRLDRDTGGRIVGRLKVYATVSRGSAGEELEQDLRDVSWDGRHLRFKRGIRGSTQEYTGVAVGRTLTGTFTQYGTAGTYSWSGERAEVLTYGLTAKSPAERAAWQARVRRQLKHLVMDGDPQPLDRKVTVLRDSLSPFPSTRLPADRDDDPAAHPATYRTRELQLDYTLPNRYAPTPLKRRVHAYLALPKRVAPGTRLPAVLSVNGHSGSAWKMLNPDDEYFWHGDAFARRGYVVMAVDVSHRPRADRRGLYGGYEGGDDPEHGNGPNPAIRAEGFDSDWEEDGERAWDAMRALDYLVSLPEVDPERVVVTGISMGGEVTTYAAALDPRLAVSVPAGYSPDLGVMIYNGNHPCWQWRNADLREYVDVPDLHALTAPRPMVVLTGKRDFIFSRRAAPFAADKQHLRRSRAAYGGEAERLVHYLHYDQHHYHIGDVNPTRESERGVRVPVLIGPAPGGDPEWQSDGETRSLGRTLFDCLDGFLGRQ